MCVFSPTYRGRWAFPDLCAQDLMATRRREWCVLVLLSYPFLSIGTGVSVFVVGTHRLPVFSATHASDTHSSCEPRFQACYGQCGFHKIQL